MADRIIIFDSLDTIQGYKGAEPGESKRFYQERIAEEHYTTIEERAVRVV